MPAAAVIPAPIAYIKVVAVKKLVVGFLLTIDWYVFCTLFGSMWASSWGTPLFLIAAGCDSRLLL